MSPRRQILTPREPAIDLIKIMGEGTYTSLANALKEFVSNAFDAKARNVWIEISEDRRSIVIKDDGYGMSTAEFELYYGSIARTNSKGSEGPKTGIWPRRKRVGRFGIGSLAVLHIADRFSVTSAKYNSGKKFRATINLAELRKYFDKDEDLSKHWRFPADVWGGQKKGTHYTELRLDGITNEITDLLQKPGERTLEEFFVTTRDLSGIDRLSWELGMICPLPYQGLGPLLKKEIDESRDGIILDAHRRLESHQFNLFINGTKVLRRVLVPSYYLHKNMKAPKRTGPFYKRGEGYEVHSVTSSPGLEVSFRGYLAVQARQLFPEELRGVILRIREVGIGKYGYHAIPAGTVSTMLKNLTGEIWVDGLDAALQFDRESFREDHPQFQLFLKELQPHVEKAETQWRKRSKKRKKSNDKKVNGTTEPEGRTPNDGEGEKKGKTGVPDYQFLPTDAFKDQGRYVTRLIPQINGCYDNAWYEACAMTGRRLAETLIIELYKRRSWYGDIEKVRKKGGGLEALINMISSGDRIKLRKEEKKGLEEIKKYGDVGAHKILNTVQKSDLDRLRTDFRLVCERMSNEILYQK